jgi:hypothetical protein
LRHKIYCFGSAAGQNHLTATAGIDKFLHFVSSTLVRLGRTMTQGMYAAMNVRVVTGLILRNRGDNCLRNLSGCGAIEVNQTLTVYVLLQCRKVFAQ